jgi:16S rRNA (guanine527-N7)-methyltransferase
MSFDAQAFKADVRRALINLDILFNEDQMHQLEVFSLEFFKWNAVHNLSSIHSYEEYLGVHVMDSLAVIKPLLQKVQQSILPENAVIADLGTGGGFPGFLLAIFMPKFTFYLVDAVRKKTSFLEHAKGRLKLKNIQVVEQRIELFAKDYPAHFDATISRAFTELKHFVDYSEPLLKNGGLLFAMKSQKISQELLGLQDTCTVLSNDELKIPYLDAYRCILAMQFMRKST